MALSRATMTVAVAVLCVTATAVTARITFRPTVGPTTPASSTAGPTASAGPTTPSQDCWPYCPNNNTLLANPRNCSTYYSCTGNLDGILQACPYGLVFVPEEQECDYPDVYNCTDDPDAPCGTQPPTQPTTLQPEPTTNEPEPTTNEPEPTGRTLFPPRSFARYGSDNGEDSLPVCPDPVCPEETALLGNPGDCTSFYSCNNYVPILMKCPEGLEFHSRFWVNKGRCKWPKNSNCTETCVLPLE